MEFYLPTKFFLEKYCVNKYGDILKKTGTHAMVVTGRTSAENGSLADVLTLLDRLGIRYVVFNEIEQNPSVETVMRAREIAVSNKVDFVIGVGGGSPLDAAKAIALMAKNPDAKEDVLYKSVELEHLPVVAVPTTAGTGSEVTQYSILTIHNKRTKKSISHAVFPAVAFADPRYLTSLPHNKLVDTAVDTLAHLMESYLSKRADNSVFCEKGLEIWGGLKDKIFKNALVDADYERLMLASALGGMAIAHTSTSVPHGLSYGVTYELGVPHGRACGMFLGGFVDTYKDREKAEKAVKLLGFETTAQFKQYMIELLGEKPLDKDFAAQNAEALAQNTAKLANHPFPLDLDDILAMENLF